jgi:hypothetical protein
LLPAAEGAVVVQALEAAREALRERRRTEAGDAPPAEVDDGGQPPAERPVSNAEALVATAELALSVSTESPSAAERYQVVVHVDAQTLAADAEGRCELAEGHPVAVETARRLSCDGSLVELQEREGVPLSLGRRRRSVSPALRRALAGRDRGCRFPGCERTRFVDAHHVRHWARGGETSLENLVLLCRRHHGLVHEGGYSVELLADGELRFRNQYGIPVASVPRPPPSHGEQLREQHEALGLTIDRETCRNGHGDRMDLALAVDAILAVAGGSS